MMKRYIYLAGPCKYEEDGGVGWRTEANKFAQHTPDYGLGIFDPTYYFDYQGDDVFQKTDRQIREYYFQAIKHSTVVLVNLNNTDKSIGTGMEVQYAVDHDIPVIGFGNEGVYPWIRDSCTVIFDTLIDALKYIGIYYDI